MPPATPGIFTFEWKMVQDLVEWYDDATPALAINVEIGPPRYLSPVSVTFPAQRQAVKPQWSPGARGRFLHPGDQGLSAAHRKCDDVSAAHASPLPVLRSLRHTAGVCLGRAPCQRGA